MKGLIIVIVLGLRKFTDGSVQNAVDVLSASTI